MRLNSLKLIFCLWVFTMHVFVSCEEQDSSIDKKEKPYLIAFYLSPSDNDELTKQWNAEISDSTVTLYCPDLEFSNNIKPRFEGHYIEMLVNGEKQVSGLSQQDFNKPVFYTLIGENNEKTVYKVIIKVSNMVPRLYIDTENKALVDSKEKYVKAKAKLLNAPDLGGALYDECKIRGRGNSTWVLYDKKPYKLKFSNKQEPFGWPKNKDYVLLPDYVDRSLLRTAYMCEVSKAVGMEYTVKYQHIEIVLNGDYIGTYLMTDLVEKAKDRINISDDGYLIEEDGAWESEPLNFPTDIYSYHYTFKYPDADDSEIKEGDVNYSFIKQFVNNFENALSLLDANPDDTSYANYIDVESFAKWHLVSEITAIEDPNRFYTLYDKKSRLKMQPMWDAEWSMGLWANTWQMKAPPSIVESEIWTRLVGRLHYFDQLMKSPLFLKTLKSEWEAVKVKLPEVRETINNLAETLIYCQDANFKRWPEPSVLIDVVNGSWKSEVDYINNFFEQRIEWLDDEINNL